MDDVIYKTMLKPPLSPALSLSFVITSLCLVPAVKRAKVMVGAVTHDKGCTPLSPYYAPFPSSSSYYYFYYYYYSASSPACFLNVFLCICTCLCLPLRVSASQYTDSHAM